MIDQLLQLEVELHQDLQAEPVAEVEEVELLELLLLQM